MKNKNKLTPTERLVRISSVMLALAIIGVCYGIARVEDASLKIGIFATSGVTAGIAVIFITSAAYLSYRKTHKRNFFLYDKRSRADRPVSELDFEYIREKVIEYMSIFKHGKRLYVGEIFIDTPWSVKEMKPLMCYELLYELSADGLDACRTFLGYGMECSRIFSEHLLQSGDVAMAADIANFFSDYARDNDVAKEFLQYVSSKKEHIEKRVVEYTKNNIDKFVL